MRDIKFRAWDKRTNTMIKNPITLQHKKGGCTIPNEYLYGKTPLIYFFGTSILLMQYTGLKDKNGIEIYEGDIVKCLYYGTYDISSKIVVYENQKGFTPIQTPVDHDEIYANECQWEVIGNIYENPELLEGEQ